MQEKQPASNTAKEPPQQAGSTQAERPVTSSKPNNSRQHLVGGQVLAPQVIHAPNPKYTNAARRAHLEGDCILGLVVDTKGRPKNIRVKKAIGDGLDESAIKALKKYQFKPATLNGQPVAVMMTVIVKFHIK